METYKPRKTAAVITALGASIMIIGLAAIVVGIISLLNPSMINVPGIILIISGIGSVILASLLYIVGNLSEDVHRLMFDVEHLAFQNGKYQRGIFEHLQEVGRDHDAIKKGIASISGKMQ